MALNESHLNKRLNRLSQIYNIPFLFDESSTIANSNSTLENFQHIILPTHNNSPNNLTSLNTISNNPRKSIDDNSESDILDFINTNTNANNSISSNTNANNSNTTNNNHNNNNNNNNNSNNIDSDNSTSSIIIGHCIIKNGGIPVNNLSKIPSYQWGFKHEEETSSNIINNTLNKDTSTNIAGAINSGTIGSIGGSNDNDHDTDTLLDLENIDMNDIPSGLGPLNGNSISTLPGNVTTSNSNGLNARMIRLPILNANINEYDKLNGDYPRSLMNGLPYFNLHAIENKIKLLNLHKKINFKSNSNSYTSWFTDSLNESIDDIEYLHGDVILNQFINNKRIIRNYQWLLYLNSRINNNKLDVDDNSLNYFQYKKLKNLRTAKFNSLKSEQYVLKQQLISINETKKKKQLAYESMHKSIPLDIDDLVDGKHSNSAIEVYGLELLNNEDSIIEKLNQLPECEEELNLKDFKIELKRDDDEPKDFTLSSIRFGQNQEYIEKHQFIIEHEYNINDQTLINYENRLKNKRLEGNNNINKFKGNGRIIKSKIIKFKRTPNPNCIGFSNIRSKKPSFL